MSNPSKLNSPKPSKFAGLITAVGIEVGKDKRQDVQPGSISSSSPPPPAQRAFPVETGNEKATAMGRRSNPDYIQISAYINRRLYRNVQKALLDQDNREVSQLLEQLLREWMASSCPGPNNSPT